MRKTGELDGVLVELLNELRAGNSLQQYKILLNEYNTHKSQIDNNHQHILMQEKNNFRMQENSIKLQYDNLINQAQNHVSQAKIALDHEKQRNKVFGDDRGFLEKDILDSSTGSRAVSKAGYQLTKAKSEKKEALRKLEQNHQDGLASLEKNRENEIDIIWDQFVNNCKLLFHENKPEILNGFEDIFNTLGQMEDPFEKVTKFLELVSKKIDTAHAYALVSITDVSDMINNTNIMDDLKYLENNYTELYSKNTKLYEELAASVDKLADKKDLLINTGIDIKNELEILEKYLEINFDDIESSSKHIYKNTKLLKQLTNDKEATIGKFENIVNNYNLVQENKDLVEMIVSIYEEIFKTLEEVQKYPILPNYNQAMASSSLDSNLKDIIKNKFNIMNINELNKFFDGNGFYTQDAKENYALLVASNNIINENINNVKDFIKSFNDNYDLFFEKIKSESKKKNIKYFLVSTFIIIFAIISYLIYINYQEQKVQENFQIVSVNCFEIKNIENPSEALQLAAIKGCGEVLEYIKNPSETVQLAAVKDNGFAIKYIENPSEALQLAAVEKHGGAIKYIENPSEALQLAAVKQNGKAVEYIKNPSEAVQLAAVKQNGTAIRYIKNPSEAVQLAAVEKYGGAIEYIRNPSEALQLVAVKQDSDALQYLKNPSEAVQLAGVRQNSDVVRYIKNPSEAVQLAAVKRHESALQYIENPSKAVQFAAKR